MLVKAQLVIKLNLHSVINGTLISRKGALHERYRVVPKLIN